jgi:hypothetical protein
MPAAHFTPNESPSREHRNHTYFLCDDKQIRSSLVTDLPLLLVSRILFSFFRFQLKSCAKRFCMRQGDRPMEAVH